MYTVNIYKLIQRNDIENFLGICVIALGTIEVYGLLVASWGKTMYFLTISLQLLFSSLWMITIVHLLYDYNIVE